MKEKMSQDIVGASGTVESEIQRECIFQGSIAAHMETLMVGLRPHIMDAACLPDGFSQILFMNIEVEAAAGVIKHVDSGFIAYNPRYDLPCTIVVKAKWDGT